MLIIKDFSRLAEFGFVKNGHKNFEKQEVWVKEVGYAGDDITLTLVVNPLDQRIVPAGEMVAVVETADDIRDGTDVTFPLEPVMEMLAAKVVAWVPDKTNLSLNTERKAAA